MRRLNVVACCLIVLLAGVRSASALPTVEELAKKLAETEKALKSYSADAKMTRSGERGTMEGAATEVAVLIRKGDKTVLKSRMTGKLVFRRPDGREVEVEHKTVNDGIHIWDELTMSGTGRIRVRKKRADGKNAWGIPESQTPLEEFASEREIYGLRVTGEETFNGEAVYVLEGTFRDAYLKKNPAAAQMKRNRYKLKLYYARKDMLQRQEIAEDADGKQSFHVVVTNVKVNPDVDEKVFEYTPPPDVRVQDATGR